MTQTNLRLASRQHPSGVGGTFLFAFARSLTDRAPRYPLEFGESKNDGLRTSRP